MELENLQKRLTKLEDDVFALVRAFEEETGFRVDKIETRGIPQCFGGMSQNLKISITQEGVCTGRHREVSIRPKT